MGVKFLAYQCNLEIIGGVVAFPCITFPLYFKISFKNSIKILSLCIFFFFFFFSPSKILFAIKYGDIIDRYRKIR